ncbi:MAG: type I-D CRISPR-associated protein Cas7/Csc2 [Bacteroidales bacterium]|nr:type I-D CRISPR-associated protein Cas7/Csc2 [Bacteroidales bacterium]
MEELFKIIAESYFVKDLKENTLGTIKIAILREVTGNLIIRSNYADETITFKASESKDIIEIPARKLKSKEKLLGLKICREFNVIDDKFRYNVIKRSEQLGNPNSILFGDSVTENNDSVGISSRAIYDWAYSIRDVNELTGTLQHNALSEGGTMWDEEGGNHRTSLFQVQYIKPGALFPHFITVENVTPELFIHLLTCILFENCYGAQSTTLGSNIKNHILGFGISKFEQPINSFSISSNWEAKSAVTIENVKAAIDTAMKATYGEENYKMPDKIIRKIKLLWESEDKKELKGLYEKSKNDCERFLKDIKVCK